MNEKKTQHDRLYFERDGDEKNNNNSNSSNILGLGKDKYGRDKEIYIDNKW